MTIAIKLSPELEERLSTLAKNTHRSKSYYARTAIEHYIEDLEDYYLAVQKLETKGRLYTLEEVKKNSDLDD